MTTTKVNARLGALEAWLVFLRDTKTAVEKEYTAAVAALDQPADRHERDRREGHVRGLRETLMSLESGRWDTGDMPVRVAQAALAGCPPALQPPEMEMGRVGWTLLQYRKGLRATRKDIELEQSS